jgi:hypothetical protein
MAFMPISAVPKGTKATCLRILAAFRPKKANPRRASFTVDGDRVCYDGDVSTKTADLTAVKKLLDSVISTPEAKFVTVDLKDFYLEMPMEPKDCACMRIVASVIPEDIMLECDLAKPVHNKHVCGCNLGSGTQPEAWGLGWQCMEDSIKRRVCGECGSEALSHQVKEVEAQRQLNRLDRFLCL